MGSTRHPAELSPAELEQQTQIRFTRRQGPGGQHRNKVETAVIVEHRPTGLIAESSERRSQADNRTQALFRLRLALALSVRVDRSNQPDPSPRWLDRVRGGKLAINERHDDFPSLVAEVLDHLNPAQGDLAPAVERLQITSSQLVKFLKKHPPAFQLVNRWRTESNRHPLK